MFSVIYLHHSGLKHVYDNVDDIQTHQINIPLFYNSVSALTPKDGWFPLAPVPG